jgi:hypothetical protein
MRADSYIRKVLKQKQKPKGSKSRGPKSAVARKIGNHSRMLSLYVHSRNYDTHIAKDISHSAILSSYFE